MAAGIGSASMRWRALCGFTIAWLALTFVSFAASLRHLSGLLILGPILGILLATLAIVKSDWKTGLVSLTIGGLMFFSLVGDQVVSGNVRDNLPILLLQFIMFLFSVEILTSVLNQQQVLSPKSISPNHTASYHVLVQRSIKDVQAQIARFGLFFASCYLITVGLLYVGSEVRSISPVLTDVSFYIVVVSVSLALLILLREE
jgi:hypothetical protein